MLFPFYVPCNHYIWCLSFYSCGIYIFIGEEDIIVLFIWFSSSIILLYILGPNSVLKKRKRIKK